MKAYGASEGIAPRVPNLGTRGEWSTWLPGRFTSRERTAGTQFIGGWVSPRASLNKVVKRKIPSPRRESNPDHSLVHPVASRYTDWAIPALRISVKRNGKEVLYKFGLIAYSVILWRRIKCWDNAAYYVSWQDVGSSGRDKEHIKILKELQSYLPPTKDE
jgi:hypothetical protein